jgi:hypothetical protein
MKTRTLIVIVALAALIGSGCRAEKSTPTPSEADQVIRGEAQVGQIQIQILESMPVQVKVVASGNLPDGCTKIDQATTRREANTFLVTIVTVRPAGAACTLAIVPFEETISLDVNGLPAGVYTVNVNGVTDSFELAVDNTLETSEIITREAPVGSIQVNIMESAPVQVSVTVRGSLPDGCTEISQIAQTRQANFISLDVFTERPADMVCTQAVVPFEETVPLEVRGLPAGTYTVDVNGVTATFELSASDVAPESPALNCPPAQEGQVPFLNADDGYCLLYPETFKVNNPQRGYVVFSGPALTAGPEAEQASLTIQNEGPANGRTAEEIANERLSEYEGSGVKIKQGVINLAGEEAIRADDVPGQTLVRQVFMVHDDTVYVFTLAPIDSAFAEATAQAEELWKVISSSFTFAQ